MTEAEFYLIAAKEAFKNSKYLEAVSYIRIAAILNKNKEINDLKELNNRKKEEKWSSAER